MTRDQLAAATRTAAVLVPTVARGCRIGTTLSAGPQLKLVANYGTGVDNIDLELARNRGIIVTNTPGILTEKKKKKSREMKLTVPRRLVEGAHFLNEGRGMGGWSPTWMLGHRIWGKKLGIIRHGPDRTGGGAARESFGPFDQLSHPLPGALRRGGGFGRDILGEPR